MDWADKVVRVRVPATSANLGPGFDALGLALTLHDDVDAWMCASGLSIEISGEGFTQMTFVIAPPSRRAPRLVRR